MACKRGFFGISLSVICKQHNSNAHFRVQLFDISPDDHPAVLNYFSYFCSMKHAIDWKHIAILAAVAGGLLYITESFWMSLGIILLLLVADYFVQQYVRKNGETD